MAKHIFVTGGVVSSLGKGIASAALGRLLKSRGLKVTIQKLDPYLNVDPGTMSPFQHGEVFVTEDGSETDLDLGHYERFIDENLTQASNVTAGQIYWAIVTKERQGEYLGGTVQVIPHVTNEIKQRIHRLSPDTDVVITEVGGTVGDIESLPFLEAIRQLKRDLGANNVLYIHVTLIPYLAAPAELKTKPTQHSVKELRSIGIQPDIIVCRSERSVSEGIKRKIALFCDVEPGEIISNVDAPDIYAVPLLLHDEGLDDTVVAKLELESAQGDLGDWQALADRIARLNKEVKIALVGKYVQLPDAYISIVEALRHAGFAHGASVQVEYLDAEALSDSLMEKELSNVDGVLVPGGFGVRGIEGKIRAVSKARVNKIPFLGICLGLQCAVVEFARQVVGLKDANSSEFNPQTRFPVIDLMPSQKQISELGGTMRLGSYPCQLKAGTRVREVYGEDTVHERHRHRYEVNNDFRQQLASKGLVFSGASPDDELLEIIELVEHPWFVATQFHPEFKSRPNRPHPIFGGFIEAALQYRDRRQGLASLPVGREK